MRSLRSRQGVGFLEIVIAVAVLAVVFLVLVRIQVLSLQVSRDAREASIATQIANDVVESIRSDVLADDSTIDYKIYDYYDCPWTVLVDCSYGPASFADGNPFGSVSSSAYRNLEAYSYRVEIRGLYNESSDPASDPRTPAQWQYEGLIEVSVDIDGPSSSSFVSYISCYDVSSTPTLEEGKPCQEPFDRAQAP